jgi:hypothetical protein
MTFDKMAFRESLMPPSGASEFSANSENRAIARAPD